MTSKLEYNKDRKQFDLVVINTNAMSEYEDEKDVGDYAGN